MMKQLTIRMLAAAMFVAAPLAGASAQQASNEVAVGQVAVGMQVLDTAEAPVGTITSRNGDNVTLKTDRHEIPQLAGSFTVQGGKAYFGMTQAQVDAQYEKMLAEVEASLLPGAPVKGMNGIKLGTIESIDAEKVVLKLDGGEVVHLPRSGIAGRADGAVVGITAEDLAKKVSAN